MPRQEAPLWLARETGVLLGALLALVTLAGTFDPVAALFVGGVAYAATLVGSAAPDADAGPAGMDLVYGSAPPPYLGALGRFLLAVVALFVVLALTGDGPVVAAGLGGVVVVAGALLVVRALPDLLHRYVPRDRGLPYELPFWTLASLGAMVASRLVLAAFDATGVALQYLPLAVGIPVVVGVVAHVSLTGTRLSVHRYVPAPVERRVLRRELQQPGSSLLGRVPLLVRFAFDRRLGWRARGIVLLAAATPVVALVAVWLALYLFVFVPLVG